MTAEKLYQKADGILDLRAREAFVAGHLVDSTWIEFLALAQSLNQLPAAPAQLFLVGEKAEIEEASILLDQKGYGVIGSLVVTSQTLDFWQSTLNDDWVAGKQSKRLWQPSSLVQEWLETHRQNLQATPPRVLDLGCGGGRDAVYLAKHGMEVIAIDNKANVLSRAKQLAQSSGAQVKFKCCDLSQIDCLPAGQFDVIIGVRFLNRALMPKLLERLNPNGFIIWQTFVENGQLIESPKNPNFILQPGELAQVFQSLDIITDKIIQLSDDRPVNNFIARKMPV